MPNSLFFLLKKAPFPFLKVNGLKFYPVAAIALQRLPLGVKADQRAALVLQLQRRVKSLDTGQIAKEREQHRLAVSVGGVAFQVACKITFVQVSIEKPVIMPFSLCAIIELTISVSK